MNNKSIAESDAFKKIGEGEQTMPNSDLWVIQKQNELRDYELAHQAQKERWDRKYEALNNLGQHMANSMAPPWNDLEEEIRNMPACIEVSSRITETPGHDLTKLILRQFAYFLLVMLAVGVGLAVFL